MHESAACALGPRRHRGTGAGRLEVIRTKGSHRFLRYRDDPSRPLAFGHGTNAVEDFGLIDVRRVEQRTGLRRDPSQHRWMRFPAHQLRDDIGVDDDHGSNEGGASTNSAGGRSRSTLPSGAKRRRIASARFGSGWSRSPVTASLRIDRASDFRRRRAAPQGRQRWWRSNIPRRS